MKKILVSLLFVMLCLPVSAGIRGDMNGDGVVDVDDMNAVINIILKVKTVDDFVGNGDMDASGDIDIDDVNHIINVILGVEEPITDYDSAIGVMEGNWMVTLKYIDVDGVINDNPYNIDFLYIYTNATENGDTDKMWLKDPYFWGIDMIVPINLENHTFAVDDTPYDENGTGNVTLFGQVFPGGGHTLSGAPIDSICIVAAFSDYPDYTWRYAGWRYMDPVEMTLIGDEVILLPLGTPYVEPGCTATLNGVDVSSSVVTIGSVDVNSVGVYELTYKAVNDIGLATYETRRVIVYDPNTVGFDISGTYNTDMNESAYISSNNRTFAEAAAIYGNTSQCTGITFEMIAPGIFYCNDLVGGWYWQIRGYGTRYAMTGYITVDNGGNVTLLDSYIPGWGDGLNYIENAHYDFGTNTISYVARYADVIDFNIVMDKVSDLK